MSNKATLIDPKVFAENLFEKLKCINLGVGELELYEFRYALKNLYPENGWDSIKLDARAEIERKINSPEFYTKIQLKPVCNGKIGLDENIFQLTTMLFVGLVTGAYPADWIQTHFYFDIRGFFFLVRTVYFSDAVRAHFGAKPWRSFEPKQKRFELFQSLGYKDFKEANAEVDRAFIESVNRIIAAKGTPILIAIAGPTAAGKTEIVELLHNFLAKAGRKITAIEMDHFLTDRDYREKNGIDSLGKQAIHFDLFIKCLQDVMQGKKIATPQYDFVEATSSHDLNGNLKPGGVPFAIEPADIIFIEGNFPFLLDEVVRLIGIKVVYLTDDPVRMKRKWKRDFDYRRKYDLNYFRNRYFKEQFLMARECYRPQMQVADLVVDTTGAAIWATPEMAEFLIVPK
jgi:uridine kinase